MPWSRKKPQRIHRLRITSNPTRGAISVYQPVSGYQGVSCGTRLDNNSNKVRDLPAHGISGRNLTAQPSPG